MPVPMIAPMPSIVRSSGPSTLRSCVSPPARALSSSIDFVAKRVTGAKMRAGGPESPEHWPKKRGRMALYRPTAGLIAFGPFRFEPGNGLWRDETEVPLPPRALGLLEALTAQPGTVVSKQSLIDAVWKDAFVTEASLLEAIRVLREALGDDRLNPVYIQTVHRRGYRFIAPSPPSRTPHRPHPSTAPHLTHPTHPSTAPRTRRT